MPAEVEDVEALLEWAGAKLIALPGRRAGPAPLRVFWPDYDQELRFSADEGFRQARALREAAPSGPELDLMDLILLLPNVIDSADRRRIVRLRTLVHPLNGRRFWHWTRLASEFGLKEYSARQLYLKGLNEIARKTPEEKIFTLRPPELAIEFSI
jgi:hypothetical protein